MTRSERMKPVVEVAESRERKAAREFAEHQHMVETECQRLDDLQGFRKEYLRGMQTQGESGMTAARLRQWQQFMAGLDRAIEQQRQQVASVESQLEQKRQQWFLARGKHKALGKVVERYRADEERVRSKREQKEIDEFAQRKRRQE